MSLMYVTRVPNRSSPPAVLLRESYRDGGKVKTRTLANLTNWPDAKVDALRRVLKGETAIVSQEELSIERSLPHGHVAAVFGMARKLGLDKLFPGLPPRLAKLTLAMIVARLIEPAAKLATAGARSGDRGAQSRRRAGLGRGRRGRTLHRARLARRGQPAIEAALARRHLRTARWCSTSLVQLSGGPALRAGVVRSQPRRQEGQAADRLRPAVRRRRLPRRDRGVRRRHADPKTLATQIES